MARSFSPFIRPFHSSLALQSPEETPLPAEEEDPHKTVRVSEVVIPNFEAEGMGSGVKLLEWHKQVGDPIKQGETLCDLETEWAEVEYEAQQDGFLAAILVKASKDTVHSPGVVLGLQVRKEENIPEAMRFWQEKEEQHSEWVHDESHK